MILKDLETLDYNSLSKNKRNKLLEQKIKIVASEQAFRRSMYLIGVSQTKRQYARLITDCEYYEKYKNSFIKNNTLKLNKDNLIFCDTIEENKYKIQPNTIIEIYTRKGKAHMNSNHSTNILEVVYLKDNQIFLI